MKQILHEHFGRGVSEDPIINDIRTTITKVRRENPKPEFSHIALSPVRAVELLRATRLHEVARQRGLSVDLLFGHPVYLDLGLEGDRAGYRVVHLR